MAATTGLPVFAYVDNKEQTNDLLQYLRLLKKDDSIPTESEDIRVIIKECGVFGEHLDSTEVETTLNSVVSLVVPLPSDQAEVVVREFCEILCGPQFSGHGTQSKAGAALRVLSNLFYVYDGPEANNRHLQFDIYSAMVKLAGRSGQITEIPYEPEKLRKWFRDWRLTTTNVQNVLRLLHQGFTNSPGHGTTEAQAKVMIELLRTYTTDAESPQAQSDARECVRAAVADPATFLFDHLLSLRPVQCLEKGDPTTYRLLNICISGRLEDYLSFHTTSGAYLKDKLGLNHEALTHKMRILSLMSLGEQKQELHLEDLSKALQLSPGDELEEFIIEAIQAGAIKARIDQVGGRLLVHGVKNRGFEKAQWEQLACRLDAWATNLRLAKRQLDTLDSTEAS